MGAGTWDTRFEKRPAMPFARWILIEVIHNEFPDAKHWRYIKCNLHGLKGNNSANTQIFTFWIWIIYIYIVVRVCVCCENDGWVSAECCKWICHGQVYIRSCEVLMNEDLVQLKLLRGSFKQSPTLLEAFGGKYNLMDLYLFQIWWSIDLVRKCLTIQGLQRMTMWLFGNDGRWIPSPAWPG